MARTDPDHDEDIFHPEPIPRRRIPAAKAIAAAAVALLLLALLDADGLRQTANRLSDGKQKTAAVWTTKNVLQPVSHSLGLNQPRKWVNQALGVKSNKITNTNQVKLAPSTTVGNTTTTTEALPRPTPSHPLQVLVSGDSLSENLGPPLIDALGGKPAKVTQDSEIGTGLARPDVIDWPSRLADDMNKGHYDAVVLMFGGNDAQDLTGAGPDHSQTVGVGDRQAWSTEYERRIALVMNTITKANPKATLIWVGMPAITGGESPYLKELWPVMNSLVKREAAARPGNVVYVDAGQVLDGPGNSFQTYANDGGTQVQVRENDGVHFTITGGHRVIDKLVVPILAKRYRL